jgi:hypothetical protein
MADRLHILMGGGKPYDCFGEEADKIILSHRTKGYRWEKCKCGTYLSSN